MEGLSSGDLNHATNEAIAGAGEELPMNVQPTFQYMYNALEALKNPEGPTDLFRGKPIFNKETQRGSTLDKVGAYGNYLAAQTLPGLYPYSPFGTHDSTSDLDYTEHNIPLVGPVARRFLSDSNFGEIEKDKNAQALVKAADDGIARSTSDSVQSILHDYGKASGEVAGLGKGWASKVGTDRVTEIKLLTSWHNKVWTPYKHELRDALSSGQTERYQELLKALDESATALKSELNH